MKFTTSLAPAKTDIFGGYASGPGACPSKIADELFGGEISGPWLCCYMIRRFGWPNTGSDDYKQLCSWTITTPMKGLYLCVTPYLGGSNLHFAVRFNKKVGRELEKDPVRDAYHKNNQRLVRKWWKSKGSKIYTLGMGLKEGDPDKLIHIYEGDIQDHPGYTWGLWERKPEHNWPNNIPKGNSYFLYWLGDFVRKNHPEVRFPKFPKRESKPKFHIKVQSALKATLKDLLSPTSVRDISFTPFGDIERSPEAIKRYSNQKSAGRFIGAGYTPEYWFKHATKAERKGQTN